jgi:hypothetical protein
VGFEKDAAPFFSLRGDAGGFFKKPLAILLYNENKQPFLLGRRGMTGVRGLFP